MVKNAVRGRKQSEALKGPARTGPPSSPPPHPIPSFVDIVRDFEPPVGSTGSFAENQYNPDGVSPPPSLDFSENSLEMSDYLSGDGVEGSGLSYDAALDSEPMFTSPPTVYVEPEVPDPFLIDDEDDSDEDTGATPTESQHTIAPAHEVPLVPATPSSPNPFGSPLQSPNRNKDVPPPPNSDSDEDEAPEIYLPGLCIPTMFLPIPNVRALSPPLLLWWLSRSSMYSSRRPIL
jgi:hypothetical protein